MILIFLSLLILVTGQCPDGYQQTFIKTSGFKPRLPFTAQLLYSSSYGASITAECYNRCKDSKECLGFILDYAVASCFRVTNGTFNSNFGLIVDQGVTFFSKTCLQLPVNYCSEAAWSVETVPGYELLGPQHTVIPNIEDKLTCIRECLTQSFRGEPCLSANYHLSTQTCILSSYNRWSNPDLFVPSVQKVTEYIENNCLEELERNICWQLPVFNTTSLRSDLQLFNISQFECKKKCESEFHFKCRGFSYLNLITPQCLLHSDSATINPGPLLYPELTPTLGGEYNEIINCVNLTVTCNKDSLNINLFSTNFNGQLSVRGFSAICSSHGKGNDVTSLIIPLPNGETNKCNVNVAYSVGNVNRTLVSTVVVVQYHELIQRSGDRVVKVNCLLSESAQPEPNNITLGTGYVIQEPGIQNEVSGLSGSNETKLKARMSLIDGRTGREVQNVKLGEPLILRIELQNPYNINTVHAGHLVASSGDRLESLLLLDWNGCPPDPAIFPSLTKTSDTTLEAPFKSFRFQSTQLLSLAVVLTFCKTLCQPIDCGNGVTSYGRKKRETDNTLEVPLKLTIMFQVEDNGNLTSNQQILQASPFGNWYTTSSENEICVSFLTAAILFLFWILLLCSFLATCCCLLTKFKDKKADTESLRHDLQPQRHVTFYDEVASPPKTLHLTTPMST